MNTPKEVFNQTGGVPNEIGSFRQFGAVSTNNSVETIRQTKRFNPTIIILKKPQAGPRIVKTIKFKSMRAYRTAQANASAKR